MVRFLAVLMVCALLPRWALAQDIAAPAPKDEPVLAPPLVPAPEQVEPEPFVPVAGPPEALQASEGMPAVPRILLETVAGGAGMAVVGTGGFALGVVTTECDLFETDCSAAFIMGLSGMVLGSAIGTWSSGSLMKGRGGFFSTMLGAILGTGAGILMLAVEDDTLGAIGLLGMPTVGAVLGYELSGSVGSSPDSHFSLTKERAPVVPSFGTTPHGGFVGGISGRF
ncbi:hypothetical protein JY651_20855 [Pyxidicoccus parkwayensis]|uniref:GlsB/YeaQ/YmgE family stress response membrane protein n=1 Tax=Pyxidicoccus parkwayensis TaxID=2813578 RepID=A0ABX7P9T2_9BACT|nr:hypothetical protein [Pyxidicoccus parkwaysis]QSQ27212.1 hypothetical protein JY651_20855 [Pyxidicoccus parkwaysis]